MNHPDHTAIDIDEQRDWLAAEKARRGTSWSSLATAIGVPMGTLSGFGANTYQGRNDRIAAEVFKYRQLLDSQAERAVGMVAAPDYFETETSKRLRGLLIVAHMGRITVGATGPGTGKTVTMREYAASVTQCWVATMRQSTRSVNAMTLEVLRAIGVKGKGGWGSQLSQLVTENVQGKRGLLVIDEANHLTLEAMEEIRAWHDATGVGICLLGNEELLMRIEGGPRRDAFARLNSRIASRHIQNLPLEGDVEAFCDAYDLSDSGMRKLLRQVALTPGAGGLRECRQIVEQASLLASDDSRPMSLGDLRDAQSTRATRSIRA